MKLTESGEVLLSPSEIADMKGDNKFVSYVYESISKGHWEGIKEGSELYIKYSSIPLKTKKSLFFRGEPASYELLKLYLEKKTEIEKSESLRQSLPIVPIEIRKYVQDYKPSSVDIDKVTGELLGEVVNERGLSEDMIKKTLRKWQYFAFLEKTDKTTAKFYGFKKVEDFRKWIMKEAAVEGVELCKNYAWLQQKMSAFKKEGIESLISKKTSLKNRQKIGLAQGEFIEKYYSLPTKPSQVAVLNLYNREALAQGWEQITETTLNRYLNLPDVQERITAGRHGVAEYMKKYEISASRRKLNFSDSLWVCDGTKVNYFYMTEKGVVASLSVYPTIDAKSRCVLGHSICIGSERSTNVRDSMRMAFINSGLEAPKQILYDNAASNVKFFDTIQDILHFPARPNHGQSKVIEALFGQIQKTIMRIRPNFTGQNITSKSLESKLNPDLIAELIKQKKMPSLEEAIYQAQIDLHYWNNLPNEQGKSPKEIYLESKHPTERNKITERDFAVCFWHEKEACTFRKNGLQMDWNLKTYEYVPLLHNGDYDISFMQNVGVRYRILINPNDLQKIALLDEKGSFVRFLSRKTELAHAVFERKDGDMANIRKHLEAQKAQKIRAEALKNSQGNILENVLNTMHQFTNKETLDKAENDYWGQQAGIPSISFEESQQTEQDPPQNEVPTTDPPAKVPNRYDSWRKTA